MPRSHKTPGRRARDVARAQQKRRVEGRVRALRDRVHTSRRTHGRPTEGEVRAARRAPDPGVQLGLGRAGKGQRHSTGPRADAIPARPRLPKRSPLVTKKKRKSGAAMPFKP
jgi:hypothetical protein